MGRRISSSWALRRLLEFSQLTHVVLVRQDQEIMEFDLPGRFHSTDATLGTEFKVDGSVELNLSVLDLKLDQYYCGLLPINFIDGSGSLQLYTVDVPPPSPFSAEDIWLMWNSYCEIEWFFNGKVRPYGKGSGARASHYESRVDISKLAILEQTAQQLILMWPTTFDVIERWLPVEIPGGRENILKTIRRENHSGQEYFLDRQTTIPFLSARDFVDQTDWTSERVAYYAEECRRELKSIGSRVSAQSSKLEYFLIRIAERCGSTEAHAVDPPVSALPTLFQEFINAALEFLLHASQLRSGLGQVPLVNPWALYEAWATHSVEQILVKLLGLPLSHERKENAQLARVWETDKNRVLFLAQPTISQEAFPIFESSIKSVTSILKPDVLIVSECEDNPPRILIIDAKHRLSVEFDTGQAAVELAKYLWGIRNCDRTQQPLGISEIQGLIISPKSIAPTLSAHSGMRFTGALPTHCELVETSLSSWLSESMII
jgi:PD-(D/E)XK nuclease superfamily